MSSVRAALREATYNLFVVSAANTLLWPSMRPPMMSIG